jgi:hypothetical protein
MHASLSLSLPWTKQGAKLICRRKKIAVERVQHLVVHRIERQQGRAGLGRRWVTQLRHLHALHWETILYNYVKFKEQPKHLYGILPVIYIQIYILVNGGMAQHEELLHLKGAMARADVFHLLSGVWVSPAERCFLWLGGFRPSEVIKVVYYY